MSQTISHSTEIQQLERRQDAVLDELDDLLVKLEQTLAEWTGSRTTTPETAVLSDSNDSPAENDSTEIDADHQTLSVESLPAPAQRSKKAA